MGSAWGRRAAPAAPGEGGIAEESPGLPGSGSGVEDSVQHLALASSHWVFWIKVSKDGRREEVRLQLRRKVLPCFPKMLPLLGCLFYVLLHMSYFLSCTQPYHALLRETSSGTDVTERSEGSEGPAWQGTRHSNPESGSPNLSSSPWSRALGAGNTVRTSEPWGFTTGHTSIACCHSTLWGSPVSQKDHGLTVTGPEFCSRLWCTLQWDTGGITSASETHFPAL